ncbi:hypothetical protein [Aquipuribacter nitratireducens]|uniref:Uncharacterized protein n=1 Tax=Aquipuribacter nitratireducens TaxID=650104 RepID=A0ABW0GLJ8_9MICO
MDRSFTPAAVTDLAEAVERDGLDAHAATLFALADRAAVVGVRPVVVGVMLDATEPVVARLRAFTLVAAAVAHRAVRGMTGLAGAARSTEPALV